MVEIVHAVWVLVLVEVAHSDIQYPNFEQMPCNLLCSLLVTLDNGGFRILVGHSVCTEYTKNKNCKVTPL